MPLRDYQLTAMHRTVEELQTHSSTLVQMATGCGKTEYALTLIHEWPGRAIFMAHMDELIRQPAKRYKKMFGEDAGIEKGADAVQEIGHADERFKLIVTSVQTMMRPKRHERFSPDDFPLMVIDEAHHAPCASYQKVISYFRQNPRLKIVGVTATPTRTDGAALGGTFDSVAFQYGIEPAIADGYLVPIRQQVVRVDGLDFSRVRTIKGDLDKEELEQILTEEKILHGVAAPSIELAGDRPTLVFCVTRKHAECMMHVLNRYKPKSAQHVNGDRKAFPLKVRHDILERFRHGDIQFLCACNLLLEGFDAPIAANLVQARPTKSPLVYEQGLGRITRRYGVPEGIATPEGRRQAIADSPKPYGTVFDFVGNAGRHKILQAADILGGRYGIPVRQYAKRTMEEEGRAVPLDEALDRADAELALEEEYGEWERRRQVKAERAQYRTDEISPFRGGSVAVHAAAPVGDPPTDKQINYIRFLADRAGQGGYWTNERLARISKKQATGLIGRLRAEAGI